LPPATPGTPGPPPREALAVPRSPARERRRADAPPRGLCGGGLRRARARAPTCSASLPCIGEIGGDTAAEACELSELRTGPSLAGAPAWERTAPSRGRISRALGPARNGPRGSSSSIDRCTVRPPRYSPSKGAALRARVSACKAQSGGVWRKLNAYVSICCWPLRGVEGCSLEARATEAARSQRSAVHCGERGRRARSSPSE
ncbi:unnamed protein product, partial [Prorocentrum cordatum]